MLKIDKRHTLSLLIAAGGCVAGAYSAYAAFSNGKFITDGAAGTMFGLAFGSVVIISWIMLPWADKRSEEGSYRDAWLWRASWLMALVFVLANSIVYTVHYRTEMTETKGLRIEAYERSKQAEELAVAEFNSLRTNPRWEATSGCSNVTAPKSKQYCEQMRNTQTRIQSAEAVLGQGRPAAKDAGAVTLAWVLSADEAKIRRSLPIFWAVILELIASLCMREAFATLRAPQGARAAASRLKAANDGFMASARDFEPSSAEVPVMGVVAPLSLERTQMPDGAMNDNFPFAAYA